MTIKMLLPLVALMTCWHGSSQAARPFMTDDARLTTEGSCQVESWTRRYADRTENWALPACNPTGNLEVTLGGGSFKDPQQGASQDQVIQAKTLWKRMTPNGWGGGVALGQFRHPSANVGPNNLGNTFVYVPLSVSFMDDRLVSHTNLGWSRDKSSRNDQFNWGMGMEYQATGRWLLIAETFGDDRQKPFWQSGLRFGVIPGVLQVDATRGAQWGAGSKNRWLSMGVRFTPEKLF
ncbi:hypothetical protein [Limnohabitans sp. 15K]|uniref:hypothetical protein n=1 Tax=Limnohabitans sp. 15K TaxID=1100706 RepID=UPI0018EB76CC|nr:hypothetical protein [Limnohabitans sp. 15K]